MALIEEYHVVADMYPVDPTTNPNLVEGQCVTLNSSGFAVSATATSVVIGIAGDTSDATTGQTPYAADLVINAEGATRSTSNRVSDMYNETLASSKVTVYTSGGKFHTDQYATGVTFTPPENLFSDASGDLTNVDGTGSKVGNLVVAPRAYPSGVPGTDTADGSLSLGNFLTFLLQINQ